MFFQIGRKSPAPSEAPLPENRPSVEIVFLDEERDYDADTFMRLPFIPRRGEEIQLDGDFRRRGCFIVEHIAYSLVCEGRRAGWVRDDLLDKYICLYVREKETEEHGHADNTPGDAREQD